MQYCLPSPMEVFTWPSELKHIQSAQTQQNIHIYCKRDDLIHPIVSGNKYRKLMASIAFLRQANIKHVVSFGGGYSNHLHALAYLCMQESIELTVCVRGDYSHQFTPMLKDISSWGTNIKFLNKQEYQNRTDSNFCHHLLTTLHAQHVIPEGGSSSHCFEGLAQLYDECTHQLEDFTHLLLPVASAGSLAGLIHAQKCSLPTIPKKFIGIAMLKGEAYLEGLTTDLLSTIETEHQARFDNNCQILHEHHHGGYAKTSAELLNFVATFNQEALNQNSEFSVMLEPVYSGKTFFALKTLIEQKHLPRNSRVIILHTGGLQALRQ